MNYELAQQLKDAGYLLRRIEPGMCVGPWPTLDMNPSGDQVIGAQHFYAPTLSELIEACGEQFEGLQRGIWTQAGGEPYWYVKNRDGEIFDGFTPEEAVAKLWLALNSKKI